MPPRIAIIKQGLWNFILVFTGVVRDLICIGTKFVLIYSPHKMQGEGFDMSKMTHEGGVE